MKIPLVLFVVESLFAQWVPFEKDDVWGYKDRQGKVVIGPRFSMAGPFSRGIAPVFLDGGWAYIDRNGRVILKAFTFDNGPDYFREGLARYMADGKIGFFDRSGKIVIKAQFDFAGRFSEGRASVCQGCRQIPAGEHFTMEGGKWGFIDRTGRLVITYQFDAAGNFEKGRARVQVRGTWKYIDKNGLAADKRRLTQMNSFSYPCSSVFIVANLTGDFSGLASESPAAGQTSGAFFPRTDAHRLRWPLSPELDIRVVIGLLQIRDSSCAERS